MPVAHGKRVLISFNSELSQAGKECNENDDFASIRLLKETLRKIGHGGDLISLYHKFHSDLDNSILTNCQELSVDMGDIERKDIEWEIRNNIFTNYHLSSGKDSSLATLSKDTWRDTLKQFQNAVIM